MGIGRVHKFIQALISGLIMLGILSFTFGCAEIEYIRRKSQKPIPPRERFVKTPPQKQPEGSLWRSQSDSAFLFTDLKAFRVNDLLTVRIVEESKASREATTKTGRTSTISASMKALFGAEQAIANKLTNFDPKAVIDTSTKNDFDGSGKTSRKDDFTATITTRVVDVLPNGNLVIEGYRETVVNNEVQWIALRGTVRQRDVQPNNTVLSTLISDVQIEYTGVGVISEKQRPGWASRILDYVWPF
jgi:flagellar L-ring protein precursor FlgH